MDIEEDTYRYAIKNAYLHKGNADLNAVVGKIFALHKDADLKKVMPKLQEIVNKVNSMDFDKIEKEYNKFEKEGYELKPAEKKEGLPELEWAAKEKVVTRFAPNPNGPFHLGNARAAILSSEYAAMYNGKFILRFDDTDPKVKKPIANAEKLFKEDLAWLGCKPSETYFASDRLDIYYKYMKELIKKGKAYVCNCNPEDWRNAVSAKKGCKCRELKEKGVMQLFEKMLKNELKEGDAVLRIKTDLQHPDPSIRDWWAAKIVDRPIHTNPKAMDKHVWPSYNFASAIDDHEMGITLIIRGQEHEQNQRKQEYLYEYFGWNHPHTIHFGRVKLEGIVLSTSEIRKGIEEGKYTGWDDPRLGTIRALRRRGFSPAAIREVILDIGIKSSDTTIEMDKLIDLNKKYIGGKSRRISFMEEGVRLDVQYAGAMEVEKDNALFELKEGTQLFTIAKNEAEKLREGSVVRLRNAYNIRVVKKDPLQVFAEFTGTAKIEKPIIDWILECREVEITMPDTTKRPGMIENINVKEGEHLYLEKFGYCVVDSKEKERLSLWFTHK